MDREKYANTQGQIFVLAQLVRALPLAEFIHAAKHADEIAPYLDPTLWMRGHDNLAHIIRLAETLHDFQLVVKSISPDPV